MKAAILCFLMVFGHITYAAIDPKYANATERGYQISGDSVVFPDGSKCDLDAFNEGTCGQKWMDIDYCVPEGKHVWNLDKCCEGLEPFLGKGKDGQPSCRKIKKKETDDQEDSSWFDNLLNNTLFWVGLILPFIVLGIFAYSVKAKIKKRNDKDSN